MTAIVIIFFTTFILNFAYALNADKIDEYFKKRKTNKKN